MEIPEISGPHCRKAYDAPKLFKYLRNDAVDAQQAAAPAALLRRVVLA
jgi:hypothetical protein